MTPLKIRVQARTVRLLNALPTAVRRAIAGRPIRLDGQELALDAQVLLRLMKLSGSGSLVAGSVEQARIEVDMGRHVVGGVAAESVGVAEVSLPGGSGEIAATLYTPDGLTSPSPLLVFYHGGGWTIGSRESHHTTAAFLAEQAGVRVLSVEYRLAPEHPFPAAVEDALSAFAYAHENAAELDVDPARIAVGGDSAGGNLAAVVAQQTVRSGGPAPAFQLLIYPAVDATVRRRSRELFAEGFFLTEADMSFFFAQYAPEGVDRADPRLSPLLADDLSGLPPAYVATAGFDPLRDEGEEYAKRLADAGVQVTHGRQADLIHGYVNFLGAGERFRDATAEAARALRIGLGIAAD